MFRTVTFSMVPVLCLMSASADDTHQLHSFSRQELTDIYYSEGATAGDINGDGNVDLVYGPHWYAGPDFAVANEIYPATPQPRKGYADHFFAWVHDFDGDGHNDVLTAGFPGTPGFVYRNPGPGNLDQLWQKHQVADQVSNEAPQFEDVTGDGIPELVCTRDGHYGFYIPNADAPLQPWNFNSISDAFAPKPFGHGLGVGDVNGDKRQDMLARDGWFEQPDSVTPNGNWKFHKFPFAPASADMFAYDVDGDGDSDIITCLSAHNFGLAWYENTATNSDGDITFKQHVLMNDKPEDSPYGLVFSEPHAVKLVDINGDGLKDIITGKTYWSHHAQSPMWDAGAVVYWFELHRGENGSVDFVPYMADGEVGIGRGLTIADVNDDGLPDIVTGGMVGGNVLLHSVEEVSDQEWKEAQPRRTVAIADGLEPLAAAANMTVPPGFNVQLAAGEPMIHQPIAMCFDHKGRLWVAEAHTYPIRAADGEGKDKILILEDTDHDGVFDKSKVFIEGLNLVSGLEVGFGGIYVGAAPYLMFIPDRNGDDIPDAAVAALPSGQSSGVSVAQTELQFPRDVPAGATVLRDGFGWHDTHETLNAFIWGPDGWLYGCHGVFTHSKVGRPGEPDEARVPVNASVWRYHPTKDIFETFMNGTSNPWGVDFNDNGQAFLTACVIPHLWQVIQGARYHRQGGRHFNPYTYDDIKTIADHAHYVGNIRDHAWWGHEPNAAGGTLAAGGGHAHAGAMVYLGDNWPEKYRNRIFFNNIHGNRVNEDILERVEGESGFVGHHGTDLLLANDHYFRGINLRYGPDGTVYLIDWYDKNACHRANPEIWDRTNGRVYRISWGDVTPESFDASEWSELKLLAAHEHRNEWYVRMARKQVMQNGCSPEMVNAYWEMVADVQRPVDRRLRYLWTLHAIGGLTAERVATLLQDKQEYVRAWAIQLELEDKQLAPELLPQLAAMAESEPSAVVRLYLCSALQRLPLQQRWPIAMGLASRSQDADDHNIPLMLWYGVEPLVPTDPERAMDLARKTQIPLLERYIVRRASAQNDTIAAVVATLGGVSDTATQLLLMQEMLAAFEGRVGIPMPGSWKATYDHLASSDQQSIRDKADQLAIIFGDQRVFPRMRHLLADASQSNDRRRQALDVLVRGRDKASGDVLLSESVLGNADLRAPAIRALASLGGDSVPSVLLAAYQRLDAATRRDVVGTLVSRPEWTAALLTSIGSGTVPTSDLHAFHVRQIQSFDNTDLNELLTKHWGAVRETSADRKQQIADWKGKLTPAVMKKAHTGNGRRMYVKTCQNCHRLFGEGGQIGPDITGSNRANMDYVLENILDPSAVVGRDYQMTVLVLQDGRVINGLLKLETDSALTVQTINDKLVIPRDEIEERVASKISIMPERQLEPMALDDVRDLIAYLRSPSQVAIAGPPSVIESTTGKVADAIEGEEMAIVDKTAGDAGTQKMNGFSKDRWSGNDQLWWRGARPGDRLSLELSVPATGTYVVDLVLTKARDYGIVKISIDDQLLEGAFDLFNSPDVITTGVLSWPDINLTEGKHRLTFEIVGANRDAVKSFMVALDYVRLRPMEQ
jgi:putative membrane-bound dehydrogenase-like protein